MNKVKKNLPEICGVVFVAIAVAGGMAIYAFVFETPSSPAIPVRPGNLAAEYDANEVAAGIKYKDRTVLVTGVVEKVEQRTYLGVPAVTLADEGAAYSRTQGYKVKCYFRDEHLRALATLSKGQTVTLRGGIGGGFGYSAGVIDVWWCTIENS